MSRYATAYEQIRAILESRTQAQPLMTAKHMSNELTCWPVPPLRTIRRYMEQVRFAKRNPWLDEEAPDAVDYKALRLENMRRAQAVTE
jgi:hypothetical protein